MKIIHFLKPTMFKILEITRKDLKHFSITKIYILITSESCVTNWDIRNNKFFIVDFRVLTFFHILFTLSFSLSKTFRSHHPSFGYNVCVRREGVFSRAPLALDLDLSWVVVWKSMRRTTLPSAYALIPE